MLDFDEEADTKKDGDQEKDKGGSGDHEDLSIVENKV